MDPKAAEACIRRGRERHSKGDHAGALPHYLEALDHDFSNTLAMHLAATCYLQQGVHGLAAALYKQVLQIEPRHLEALQNLGKCYKDENNNELARKTWRIALDIENDADLWGNIGATYTNNGTPDEAIQALTEGLKLRPNDKSIRHNLALAYLEKGDWEQGFALYDERLGLMTPERHAKRLPRWDGTPGKRVIVWGEQGVGDEIMFASCLPDAIAVAGKVAFECHPRLLETFRRSFPGIECHGTRKVLVPQWIDYDQWDAQISVASLPRLFRKTDADFPGTPYLKPDAEKVARFRGNANKPRIGVAWKGGIKKTRSDLRSIELATLLPVFSAIDADWHSLHYMPEAPAEILDLDFEAGVRLRHGARVISAENMDDFNALVASMDLIITVCTTLVHQAGAMGVPAWCLVPDKPAWRYRVAGDTMPVYESVQLIRQEPGQPWERVAERVADMLSQTVRTMREAA